MAGHGEYAAYVRDAFAGLGPPFADEVAVRAMFGGFGVFFADAMFALIADDTLYFKADAANRADYLAAGGEIFIYDKAGRSVAIAYYALPDLSLDEPEALRPWAESALAAARRARAGKRRKAGGTHAGRRRGAGSVL